MPDFPAQAKPRPLTRGDQLRDALGRLDALVGQLGYALGEEALNIPSLFDEVSAGLAELQAQGQDVRGEATQLKIVSAELQHKAATFLREIGGSSRLRDARSARQPDPAQWGWFLDNGSRIGGALNCAGCCNGQSWQHCSWPRCALSTSNSWPPIRYTRASTLEAQNNLEITAIARVQLGMLMQIPSTPTGTGPR